ncbi:MULTISPECIES: hypothetical protein [Bacillus cereus group]|uniref:Uncharacterized protein n=1 Tax=Bacillus thuringiensis TaxID=1428 RepID=A0A9X7GG65_BACTU|nr:MULTISPECIES: hypothetical protein [Bacillus cereus group]MEB9419892.1 hypothetical protein [Bacillus cereus]MRD20731.1 hypothetical protein [Bacillus thuringiensis]PFV35778.1 hypothetical protein COK99_01780 [Bacillus thuringiensis]
MARVKLIDAISLIPLHQTSVGQVYFDISVPQVGSIIKYYKHNGLKRFQGDFTLYQVQSVIQDLQERDGDYFERFEVRLLKM